MGLLSFLFGIGQNSEALKLVEQYEPLMLNTVNNNFPARDPKGNKLSNIMDLNISGTTFNHLDSNPSKVIPKLEHGERLVLAPNPENEHDPEAIRVLTLRGKQIGWIPRSYEGKSLIFRRLQEGYHICCFVNDHGENKNGAPWCEIKVATYETPFEESIDKKYPDGYITNILRLKGLI